MTKASFCPTVSQDSHVLEITLQKSFVPSLFLFSGSKYEAEPTCNLGSVFFTSTRSDDGLSNLDSTTPGIFFQVNN